MIELTQTTLGLEGNCWQTCVASILEIDPATMPAQSKYDRVTKGADGNNVYGPSYSNVLRAFLRDHHGLTYAEVYSHTIAGLAVRDPGWHMILGPTERSASLGGMRHVVVGRYGVPVWDPHPSRAGLLERDISWGLLVPFPEEWRDKKSMGGVCECPACLVAPQ